MNNYKTKLKAIRQILIDKPLVYNVKFHDPGLIKITKNMGIFISNNCVNLHIDMENIDLANSSPKPQSKSNNKEK